MDILDDGVANSSYVSLMAFLKLQENGSIQLEAIP
jgi:hypothetical protein